MGLFSIFKGKQLPPGDPATQKAGQKLISKNVEPGTRFAAADTLAEIGTNEAIFCLLQRFTVVIGTAIPDEDEKMHVYRKIRAMGNRAAESVVRFLKEKEHAGIALELLRDITDTDSYYQRLLELIDTFDPYYSKYPDKKIQTFKVLKDYGNPEIIKKLEPFLDDDDDDVRLAALDAIVAQADEDASRENLINLIIGSEEQPRIRIAACEAMAKLNWRVKGYKNQIQDVLPDRFYMDAKGQIKIKGGSISGVS